MGNSGLLTSEEEAEDLGAGMSLLSPTIGRVRCLADEEADHNMLQGKFHSLLSISTPAYSLYYTL